ncbi:hypothetical protein [Lacibacter sp.]|uniref:hypothetical protein n=1 Tax=Lacibacter sp. TaxID=1915409 RepID=UPI002B4B7721|nr:hypothetical protein [Lacibacter sp.]HLP39528.1 hypothetical protein [Lacibacter sp.]
MILLIFWGTVLLVITIRVYIKLRPPAFLKKGGKGKIDFKSYSNKLEVKLANCEIKTNKYTEEVSRPLSRISMLDGLYQGERNLTLIEKTVTVFIYTHTKPDGSKVKFYSPPIYKDESVIERYLYEDVSVIIYIEDSANYYFDISFLI